MSARVQGAVRVHRADRIEQPLHDRLRDLPERCFARPA